MSARLQIHEIKQTAVAIDWSTSPELGTTSRLDWSARRSPWGSRAMDQIRLQRVRGLDRVLRGRQDDMRPHIHNIRKCTVALGSFTSPELAMTSGLT